MPPELVLHARAGTSPPRIRRRRSALGDVFLFRLHDFRLPQVSTLDIAFMRDCESSVLSTRLVLDRRAPGETRNLVKNHRMSVHDEMGQLLLLRSLQNLDDGIQNSEAAAEGDGFLAAAPQLVQRICRDSRTDPGEPAEPDRPRTLFSFRRSGALCAPARTSLDVSLVPLESAFFAGALAPGFFVLLVMAQAYLASDRRRALLQYI